MKNSPLIIYLLFAGLTMLMVGAYIALTPNDYFATMNPDIMPINKFDAPPLSLASKDMLSDLRGMGGMLLFVGAFALFSVFKVQWRISALITSTLVFSAYVSMRSLGFLFDGLPSAPILIAYGIELVFALLGMALLLKREKRSKRLVGFSNDLLHN